MKCASCQIHFCNMYHFLEIKYNLPFLFLQISVEHVYHFLWVDHGDIRLINSLSETPDPQLIQASCILHVHTKFYTILTPFVRTHIACAVLAQRA